MTEETGATVRDWTDLVRRSRLDRTTKYVALLLATYADSDGTRVYPGVARVAVQTDLGYRTVQRVLARLRAVGLIEPVRRRTARRTDSTEYRLILGPQLLDHIDVPTPTVERLAIERLAARYRGRHRRTARHPDGAQTLPLNDPTSRHPDGAQTADCTPPHDTTARHPDGTPPPIDLDTRTTAQQPNTARTAAAGPRANRSDDRIPAPVVVSPGPPSSCGQCVQGYRLAGDSLIRCDCAGAAA